MRRLDGLRVGHLTRGHGELAVLRANIRVALDGDVVRRIEEGGVDLGVLTDHPTQKFGIAAVSAADAVIAENPDVAELGAGRLGRRGEGRVVVVRQGLVFQHDVDLAHGEAGQLQVDLDLRGLDIDDHFAQQVRIPSGFLGDAIVGDPQRFLLRLAQAGQSNGRYGFEPALLGRQRPAVAGDDQPSFINQYGVYEAKGLDVAGQLLDLFGRVGPGIGRIVIEVFERAVDDLECARRRIHGEHGDNSFDEMDLRQPLRLTHADA